MTTEMIVTLTKAIVGLVAAGLIVAGKWKIFEKMGENGWKALIPVYSGYLIFKHTWSKKAFWATLATATVLGVAKVLVEKTPSLTPAMAVEGVAGIVAIVLAVTAAYKLAKAFGHGIGYTFGLLFAQPIFTLVIGFGKSRFVNV